MKRVLILIIAISAFLLMALPATALAATITSISPTSGPEAGGNAVIIYGTGLGTVTEVLFGDADASSSLRLVSDASVTVTAPAHAAGAVTVQVTMLDASIVTSSYTYLPAPVVSDVAPASGKAAGGTLVTITGSNFEGLKNVRFGTSYGLSPTLVSPTEITVTAPAHAAGTVNVTVTTSGGTSAAGPTYTYIAAPTVTSLSPNIGLANLVSPTYNSTVTITGTGFDSVTAVKFGGKNAITWTRVSSTQITATPPNSAAATADVVVTAAGGTSSVSGAGNNYTYVARPTISAITPISGPISGGTEVVITGSNFTAATAVKFGSSTALYEVISSTKIMATAPAHAAGMVQISVTNRAGTSANTANDDFTYVTTGICRYEQIDPRFTFSGTWSSVYLPSYSKGSLKRTYASGASLRFSFIGSSVTLIATTAPSYGSAKITLDGVTVSRADMYSATTLYKQPVWTRTGLDATVHTVQVDYDTTHNASATGTTWPINIDAVDIVGALQADPLVRYDQTNSLLHYLGNWVLGSSSTFWNGTDRVTITAGSSVTIYFTGTYMAWIGEKRPDSGIAKVTLDNNAPEYPSLYRATKLAKTIIWEVPGVLASGLHTVKIEYTGTHADGSTGNRIGIDAVDVAGKLVDAKPPRFEETDSRLIYSGSWALYPSATSTPLSVYSGGRYKYSNVTGNQVSMTFTGTYFAWIAKTAYNQGIATILVDGIPYGTVDLYSPTTGYKKAMLELSYASSVTHTVTIRVSGTKNPKAGGYYVNLDAIDVMGTLN